MSLRLKRRTVRQITGSWLTFRHPNDQEGEYWNEAARAFSARDWEEKVAEMAGIGIETIVIGAVVLRGKAFYPSAVVPERWDLACEDPLEAVLSAADRLGVEVFVAAGAPNGDADLLRELNDRYGSHRSFHGWNLPAEAVIDQRFSDETLATANRLAEQCRALEPRRPVLLAASGIGTVGDEERLAEQLAALKVDHLVYRDGVGARRNEPSDLGEIFGKMARIHKKADRPLWGSVELFVFEGPTGASAWLPAPFTRVKTQIDALSPHVRKLFCHQCLGLMNPGASTAFAGHTSSGRLHYDYDEWRAEQAEQQGR